MFGSAFFAGIQVKFRDRSTDMWLWNDNGC